MPQFVVGQSKTARVRMKNPTGKAFNYSGSILFSLLPVSEKLFSLGAGEERDVSFPVVMPDRIGAHPVHIGVFSGSTPVALYQATEGVTISPVGIDLGTFRILSVEGLGFSRVGPGYGELASPLIRPGLQGMNVTWHNTGIVPSVRYFSHDDFERWNWWMGFEPQFDPSYWVEDQWRIVGTPPNEYEELEPGHWETPAFPTYMNRPIYTPTSFPPIGGPYKVDIAGLHSGGRVDLPGLYDGVFFLEQVYRDYMSSPAIYWRIKNLIQVTG